MMEKQFMEKNNSEAKDWILKAQNDLKSAEILLREDGPSDSICFHCHQVAEKSLKSFLVFNKKEYNKVHDLIYLAGVCQKIDKDFKEIKKMTTFLNRYYIESRYPSDVYSYSEEECKKAVDSAQKILQLIINKII